MVDIREDRNSADLLLKSLTTVPGTLLAPDLLLSPKNHFLSRNTGRGFLSSSKHFGDAMGTWAELNPSWMRQHQDRCPFQRQLSLQGIHATDLMMRK